jgi:hypothetical protein
MCHTLGFKLLGLKGADDDTLTAALCLEGRMFSVGEIRGLRLASYRPKLVTAGIGKAAYRGGA